MSEEEKKDSGKQSADKKEQVQQVASANKLLERSPEEVYIEEWTDLVKTEKERETAAEESSIVLFRLGKDWLGLSTLVFTEVIRKREIHTIPHRSNAVLLGCVNFRGRLVLCASLHEVLEINGLGAKEDGKERMLAVEQEQNAWVLPVDEVYGVLRVDLNKLENVPVNVKKSTANFIRGIFQWDNKHVAIIDEDLLFYSLRRSLV